MIELKIRGKEHWKKWFFKCFFKLLTSLFCSGGHSGWYNSSFSYAFSSPLKTSLRTHAIMFTTVLSYAPLSLARSHLEVYHYRLSNMHFYISLNKYIKYLVYIVLYFICMNFAVIEANAYVLV